MNEGVATNHDSQNQVNKFAFNDKKEFNFTLLRMVKGLEAVLLKIRLFLSFQMTQTHGSQITLKNEWHDCGIAAICLNWIKWSQSTHGETEESWNHCQTRDKTLPKVAQPKKRWYAVFRELHPPWSVVWEM